MDNSQTSIVEAALGLFLEERGKNRLLIDHAERFSQRQTLRKACLAAAHGITTCAVARRATKTLHSDKG